MHLLLPGQGNSGVTLEIFQYNQNEPHSLPVCANREGLGHLAFAVDDVTAMQTAVLVAGGKSLGQIASKAFARGTLTFVYVTDPEDNIIELTHWEPIGK
ncbi:MAG TPA: hypothetical protein PKL83_00260 [bacterium]|nr:hypothetical protein [bacterium]